MITRILIALCFMFGCSTAVAFSTAQCEPYEAATIEMDFAIATEMAASAAAAVGDTQIYASWFGSYTSQNAEHVRSVYKSIHALLKSERVAFVCSTKSDGTCGNAFAWVNAISGVIRLCPSYFRLPSMERALQGESMIFGSREGTLIHEISHAVRNTIDACSNWPVCLTLASHSPLVAIEEANIYEFFAEDLMLQRMR